MPRIKKTHDVFLSHGLDLVREAKAIAKEFSDAGLTVFDASEIKPGYDIMEETWQALAESWAVVVLIKTGTMPPSVAVEIGAASAWNKPVYVLMEGKGEYHLPLYISQHEVFELSEVGKVVESIRDALRPMSEDQREILKQAYHTLGVPTDRLLQDPNSIDKLRRVLSKDAHTVVSGERIMQELLRLRKAGKLPKLAPGKSK
jgi:nucleoside 2-deoxyribosyltransferase